MALIGTHISVAGGLVKAFDRADALGCEAMQIFTRNQRQWQNKPVSLEEARAFYDAWKLSGVKDVTTHASYLINIASDNGEMLNKSRIALIDEIERCGQLGIDKIVLHPGFANNADEETALMTICDSLRFVFDMTQYFKDVNILLETMAGQGSAIGGCLEHFTRIGDELDWPERLAFCVDTCHVYAAGYDLRSADAYERFVSALDRHIGIGNIFCWHINDCKSVRGSHLDRHEHIGEGEIGQAPFSMIVNDERFENVPAILETPKDGIGDVGNLAFLRKVRGR
ncbi:MAG: deoxyribonuclease IV [Synergistes sp.]|nr:deoxyribonuclease IV [Synergistes sp.]